MSAWIWGFGVALFAYVAAAVYLMIREPRLLYHPERVHGASPAAHGLAFEDVHFKASDGERLHGWYVPNPAARGVVLFCHGNTGNVSQCIETIQLYFEMGFSMFVFDYRGYGFSSGEPSEDGTYRDGLAAWEHLVEQRGVPAQDIVLFGRSLGGGVTTWLATQVQPRAVIIESTFLSMPDVAQRLYPYVPVRWLARIRYDNLERMPNIPWPTLIVHSRDDELIPIEQGRRLFEAHRGPKRFHEIRGRHNDGFITSGALYSAGVAEFLSEHFPRR